MFYGPFSDYVITTPAGQTVEQNLYDSIYKAVAGNAAQPQHEGAEQAAPEPEQAAPEPERQKPTANTTEDVLNAMKIPQFMFQSVFAQSDFLVRTAQLTVAEAVSKSLAGAFMKACWDFALFVAVDWAMAFCELY